MPDAEFARMAMGREKVHQLHQRLIREDAPGCRGSRGRESRGGKPGTLHDCAPPRTSNL